MRNITFLSAFFFISILSAYAQNKFTINGVMHDSNTGESLIGGTMTVKELPSTGVTTNAYGFYSLTIPEGKYTFIFRYTGYMEKDTSIDFHKNVKMDIDLPEKITSLHEVEVSSSAANKNITSPQMSIQKINIKEVNSVPVFLGEKDILKTIQLLPGIKGIVEGNSGFYVRGGGLDQNLILLDGANIYNPGHMLGFFSVFNSDAIKDVTVYKGGIPAEYGGRISSVIDVKMNDGDNKEFKITGGIGQIASRLTIEGPIVKNKGSFIVSGRRTYADLFLRIWGPGNVKNSRLYFYDLNAKGNYQLGAKDKIFLSGYFGRDNFKFNNNLNSNRNFGLDWGNATITLRENHLFSNKLFLNSSFIFSNYSNNITLGTGDTQFQVTTGIRDYSVKEDFEYFIDAKNMVKFGFESAYHTCRPGEVTINSASATIRPTVLDRTIQRKYALENGFYISDDLTLSKKINITVGLRYSLFTDLGAATIYTYNDEGNVVDSSQYSSNQPIKTYSGIEPRFSISYILNESNSLKASYNRINQYMHLLSNATAETPVDLWIPCSPAVKPQIGDQVALGYFRNFKQNAYESSVEVYYKNMANQIDYKPGADLRFNKTVESQLLFGTGNAYGAEFFLKKKTGRLNGWISYTYSRTLRKFDGIDNGNTFPARQDVIHDISVVGIYDLNKYWTFSATWVYFTGSAVTWPSGKYQIDGQVVNLFTQRNGYRMPPYHRMDMGVTWNVKKTHKIESSWNFSVYNIYARENAFSVSFQKDPNDPARTQAVQLSLFRFVPAFTYNFKF